MAQDYSKILNNTEIIKWAKTHLKKRNRIEWYLKQVKEKPELHPSQELIHFYAMSIPSIEEYLPTDSLENVLKAFKFLEEEYLKKQETNQLILPTPQERIFLDCGENFFWVNLGVHSSKEEGQAMGHCGNNGGRLEDRMLSLRKKTSKAGTIFWEPHLTFVLDDSGFLGERKGKQNTKPHEKYHPFILLLLKDPRIKGIKSGGGYLPKNNFHYQDLNKEVFNNFIQEYPNKISSTQKKISTYYNNSDFLVNCTDEEEIAELEHYGFDWCSEETAKSLLVKSKHVKIKRKFFQKITDLDFIKMLVNSESESIESKYMNMSQSIFREIQYEDTFGKMNLSEQEKKSLYQVFARLHQLTEQRSNSDYRTISYSFLRNMEKETVKSIVKEEISQNQNISLTRIDFLVYSTLSLVGPNDESMVDFLLEISRKNVSKQGAILESLNRRIPSFLNFDPLFKKLTLVERFSLYREIEVYAGLIELLKKETNGELKLILARKAALLDLNYKIKDDKRRLNIYSRDETICNSVLADAISFRSKTISELEYIKCVLTLQGSRESSLIRIVEQQIKMFSKWHPENYLKYRINFPKESLKFFKELMSGKIFSR